jgi:hypothetical protein
MGSSKKQDADAEIVRKIAKGKLRCECRMGNWKSFFYAGTPPASFFAGCKKCGRAYTHKNGKWELITGP